MIQIKKMDFVPDLPYMMYSSRELFCLRHHIHEFTKRSQEIWLIAFNFKPMIVLGIVPGEKDRPPHMWLLLCKAFEDKGVIWHMRTLKWVMPLLHKRFPQLETFVERDWDIGQRFAQFCGFRPSGETVYEQFRAYSVMEL